MIRSQITIKHKFGLHARPAAKFVQMVRSFDANVIVEKDGERVNGKSIMGLMMLAISSGETVFVETDGPDETRARDAIVNFLENGEGEDP